MEDFFRQNGIPKEAIATEEQKQELLNSQEEEVQEEVQEEQTQELENKEEVQEVKKEEVQSDELTDDKIFEYLGKKLEREITSYDDLVKVEEKVVEKEIQLSEDLAALKKFKEETNGTIEDFFNANKDWSKESEDVRMTEYLRDKYPQLDDELLSHKLSKMKRSLKPLSEDEKESMDESEISEYNERQMDAKVDWKLQLAEADIFLSERAKKYTIPKQDPSKELETIRGEFTREAGEKLASIESFEYGGMKRTLDEKRKQSLLEKGSTLESFVSIFKNEKGYDHAKMFEAIDFVEGKEQIIKDLKENLRVELKNEMIKEQNNHQDPIVQERKEDNGDGGRARMKEKLGY